MISANNPGLAEATASLISYIVRPIPDKGQGLIAVQNIPKGNRILSEKPVFTVSSIGANHDLNQLITNKLKRVPKDNQQAFLAFTTTFEAPWPPSSALSKPTPSH